jgi:predicted thioredoxin/glutaredoxin
MVVRNITTKQNCGNNNILLHRLRNLVAIHGLPIAMVTYITTKQNCGNSNKLLHRLRNLVAIHGLPIAMVVRNITT